MCCAWTFSTRVLMARWGGDWLNLLLNDRG